MSFDKLLLSISYNIILIKWVFENFIYVNSSFTYFLFFKLIKNNGSISAYNVFYVGEADIIIYFIISLNFQMLCLINHAMLNLE